MAYWLRFAKIIYFLRLPFALSGRTAAARISSLASMIESKNLGQKILLRIPKEAKLVCFGWCYALSFRFMPTTVVRAFSSSSWMMLTRSVSRFILAILIRSKETLAVEMD